MSFHDLSSFVAKRDTKGVPIWTLHEISENGNDTVIGTMTIFEGEGPMATVHYSDGDMGFPAKGDRDKATVSGKDAKDCLGNAKESYFELIENYWSDMYVPDEDGEIAREKMESEKYQLWNPDRDHELRW
jgi:hypothetical protein